MAAPLDPNAPAKAPVKPVAPVAATAPAQPGQPPAPAPLPLAPTAPATSAPVAPTAAAPTAPPVPAPTPAPASSSLLSTTITPPTTNRVQLANDAIATSAAATDPYYQKSLRDATSQAATAGQLRSGQLRTSLGDLSHQRQLELDTLRAKAINDASTGSIADQYANVGIAQQQQSFQAQEAARAEQQRLANEQLQLAKTGQSAQTALAEGSLTGKYGGADTLAARQTADATALANKQFDLSSTLGTGQLALATKANEQQYGLAGQQLDLAKTGQSQNFDLASKGLGLQTELGRGGLELAKAGQEQAGSQFGQSLDVQKQQLAAQNALAQKQQELNQLVQTGQLTIAQANQKLAELQNSQNFGLQTEGLTLAKKAQDIGVDQFGKQFEAGQQSTAFNQAAQQAQIEEALRMGDFTRAQALLQAGSFGNPSDTALTLANSYGQQAGQAGSAAAGLVGSAVQNANAGATAGQGGGAPIDLAGSPVDWTSILGSLPGLGGDLPPLSNVGGGGLPLDTGYSGPIFQPRRPADLHLAGAY